MKSSIDRSKSNFNLLNNVIRVEIFSVCVRGFMLSHHKLVDIDLSIQFVNQLTLLITNYANIETQK